MDKNATFILECYIDSAQIIKKKAFLPAIPIVSAPAMFTAVVNWLGSSGASLLEKLNADSQNYFSNISMLIQELQRIKNDTQDGSEPQILVNSFIAQISKEQKPLLAVKNIAAFSAGNASKEKVQGVVNGLYSAKKSADNLNAIVEKLKGQVEQLKASYNSNKKPEGILDKVKPFFVKPVPANFSNLSGYIANIQDKSKQFKSGIDNILSNMQKEIQEANANASAVTENKEDVQQQTSDFMKSI